MTQNQIAYWNLQETKRSNVAKEQETNRHQVATEKETNRHNVVTEGETSRHNLQTERLDISKLNETQRHNLATENLTNRELSIRDNANAITKAYNDAIVALRGAELDLAQRRELQRIEESKRDFEEAVRMNDYKAAEMAMNTGATGIKTIIGNSGLVPGIAGAAGVTAGLAMTKKAANTGPSLRPDIFKSTGVKASPKTTKASGTTLFAIPSYVLDVFENTMYGGGSSASQGYLMN